MTTHMKTHETHMNDLKQSVQEQEFSMEDVHKMESELKGLAEAADRVQATREQHRQTLRIVEDELVTVTNELEATVISYNA